MSSHTCFPCLLSIQEGKKNRYKKRLGESTTAPSIRLAEDFELMDVISLKSIHDA